MLNPMNFKIFNIEWLLVVVELENVLKAQQSVAFLSKKAIASNQRFMQFTTIPNTGAPNQLTNSYQKGKWACKMSCE